MTPLVSEMSEELFKAAVASFPSGVTIVTTRDEAGTPWGFTASAFSSLSLDPPLVLVCIAKSAQCQPVFARARRWMIHVLGTEHGTLAQSFAVRGADKFAGGEFSDWGGLPALAGVPALLECEEHAKYDIGDHTILIGRVRNAALAPALPMVYHDRAFHPLVPSAA